LLGHSRRGIRTEQFMGRQLGLLRLAVSSARAPGWNLRPPPSVVLLGGPTRPHAGAVSFWTSVLLRRLVLSALNYREIPLGPDGSVRFKCKRGVQQIANSPDPIRDAQCNARRGPQGLVNPAEIVMRHVQADCSGMMGRLGKPGIRAWRACDLICRDVLVRRPPRLPASHREPLLG
jgi:hypothetical protein